MSTQVASSQTNARSDKVGVLEKLGFGAGDLASNLLFQAFHMFVLFFYTDVVGLSAASIFYLFLIAKFWDLVNDPLMGIVADRTHTRWGRYRPYLFVLAIPYGLSAYLLFQVPELSETGKIFYCAATYILATMMYTAINIPYCALMGVITSDPVERNSLSQYRFLMAFLGGWIITTFTLPLVKLFGSDSGSATFNQDIGYDPVAGYSTAMVVFAVLAAVMFFFAFFTTRERVVPVAEKKRPFTRDLKDLLGNRPWLILFISAVLYLAHHGIRNGSMLYYLNYYLADSARVLFSVNFGFFELEFTRTVLFMSAGTLIAVLGVFPVQYLLRRFDKRMLYMSVLVLQGVLEAAIYFVPSDNYSVILSLHLLSNIVGGAGPVIAFSMYADVADYAEWKFSRRANGLIMATILFGYKVGLWIGAQLLAGILALVGYTKATTTEPLVQEWVLLSFTLIPGALIIAAGLVLLKYPLTNKEMLNIEADLASQKENT